MPIDIFEEVRALNLPAGEYAVFGSGPMAIRGMREGKDADLIVTKELFDHYSNDSDSKWKTKIADCGAEGLVYGNVEMFNVWRPGDWKAEKLIEDAEIIDGLPFVRLSEVIKWKEIYGREKDRHDIELINRYLEQHSR